MRFWFKDLAITGSKLNVNKERAFGPILFAQHTLSNKILKMTAQMPPIGVSDSQTVLLQIKDSESDQWQRKAAADIDLFARTATFRIAGWDDTKDRPYRLVYKMKDPNGDMRDYYWNGTIRKNPKNKEQIVVAGFTGNNDLGFPNAEVVKNVSIHNPDILVFTGDQIYERVGGYGVRYEPFDKACLDYLHKWYIWGWSFGDLIRDIPSVCLLDDHDVYHGNLWGEGGKKN